MNHFTSKILFNGLPIHGVWLQRLQVRTPPLDNAASTPAGVGWGDGGILVRLKYHVSYIDGLIQH